MEILGLSLAMLGLIFAYIWRANGKLQKGMMQALERIDGGQEGMMQALERIERGQEGMMQALGQIGEGQKEIAQMLFNQTKILERIEAKIPFPSVG